MRSVVDVNGIVVTLDHQLLTLTGSVVNVNGIVVTRSSAVELQRQAELQQQQQASDDVSLPKKTNMYALRQVRRRSAVHNTPFQINSSCVLNA